MFSPSFFHGFNVVNTINSIESTNDGHLKQQVMKTVFDLQG